MVIWIWKLRNSQLASFVLHAQVAIGRGVGVDRCCLVTWKLFLLCIGTSGLCKSRGYRGFVQSAHLQRRVCELIAVIECEVLTSQKLCFWNFCLVVLIWAIWERFTFKKGFFSAPKSWDMRFRSLNCSILNHHVFLFSHFIWNQRKKREFSMGLTASVI